jgi:hypothetical protein
VLSSIDEGHPGVFTPPELYNATDFLDNAEVAIRNSEVTRFIEQ